MTAGTPKFDYELFKKAEHGAGDPGALQKLRMLDQEAGRAEGLFSSENNRAAQELKKYESLYPFEMSLLQNEKIWMNLEPEEQVQILSNVTDENMRTFLKEKFGITMHLEQEESQ